MQLSWCSGAHSGVRRPRIWCRTPAWSQRSDWSPGPGLIDLADHHLTVPGGAGYAAVLKVSAPFGGMVTGAVSISDMAVLRHAGMGQLFLGVRAASTLGTFLRSFRFGHVRKLGRGRVQVPDRPVGTPR
jgi:hypothetical protein